jgi:hypothetical protein
VERLDQLPVHRPAAAAAAVRHAGEAVAVHLSPLLLLVSNSKLPLTLGCWLMTDTTAAASEENLYT